MNILIGGAIITSLLIPQLVLSIQPIIPSFNRESGESSGITISGDSDDPSIETRDQGEILWLARAIYSETKNESEMRLVGWVIRNRVENMYWGATTYKEVVTQPKQFSGLNPADKQYVQNTSLTLSDTYEVWQKAIRIATEVFYADGSNRPFDRSVQHFYSPTVVQAPHWADNEKHAFTTTDNSFAFYKDVQ
jgi:spore germination cell wall hydrolase CwlJ-like protein